MNDTTATLLLVCLLVGCDSNVATDDRLGPGGDPVAAEAKPELTKGPHRGRLLADGDFQIEVAIFEHGVPPEFHVYPTLAGEPLDPAQVNLAIALTRLDGEVDRFTFTPEQDYLKSNTSVHEPHSFGVRIEAEHAKRAHVWTYDSFEGRTVIKPEAARAAGIEAAIAGAAVLHETVTLYGSVQANPERVRAVTARFPGVIRSVAAKIGDSVKSGTTLATIESNESLQAYSVAAPISGIVTQRAANPGEATGTEPLFVVSDFSTLWAELTAFPRDRARLSRGQVVNVVATDGTQKGQGVLSHVLPTGRGANQGLLVRVALDNANGQWTPGLFVTGNVIVGETPVELAVPVAALQTFRDFTVVFAQVGDTYEVRMLELGRSDGAMTEVLSGLNPGTRYVSANSYLIKADIEKSAASHDH